METLRVAVAQIPNRVGDLDGNSRRILEAMHWAEKERADVLVLPELCLPGYPVGDLARRRGFVDEVQERTRWLARHSENVTTIVGTLGHVAPVQRWDTQVRTLSIAAAVISHGELCGYYGKTLLPNYRTFNESRTFAPGNEPGTTWRIGPVRVGIAICEELWAGANAPVSPPDAQAAAGAQILLVPNASPFYPGKQEERIHNSTIVARRTGLPVVYVNGVGGQDEAVFDGGSFVVDSNGKVLHCAKRFEADRFCIDVPTRDLSTRLSDGYGTYGPPTRLVHSRPQLYRSPMPPPPSVDALTHLELVWKALVTGTRDFVQGKKVVMPKVVLPWWLGINALVTGAVAAEAVGAQNVLAVMMPDDRQRDEMNAAEEMATKLGIECIRLPVGTLARNADKRMHGLLRDQNASNGVSGNLALTRQMILLSIANTTGRFPLATVDKTCLLLGVPPLHADLTGKFAPLRGCLRSVLFDLAEHRLAAVMPQAMRAHRHGPLLTEHTWECDMVDAVLRRCVEGGENLEEIVRGTRLEETTVAGVLQLVDKAEGRRREAPIGLDISREGAPHNQVINHWRSSDGRGLALADISPNGSNAALT